MRKFWKLAVLASLAALGVLAIQSGGAVSPTGVSANIGTLTAPDTSVDSGQGIVITVPADVDSGDISITRTGVGSGSTAVFKVTDCNGCDDENQTGQAVTIDSSAAAGFDGTLEVTLTVTCTSDDPMVVHATQSNTEDLSVTCNALVPNVTVSTDASDDDTQEFDYSLRGPGSACDKDFTQQDGDTDSFSSCQTSSTNSYTLTQDVPTGWVVDSIDCTRSGISSSNVTIDEAAGTVEFILEHANDSIDCTYTDVLAGTATPKPTSTPSAPSSVTVAVTPTTVGCQSSAFVTVTVKGAGGAAVANNTPVEIKASVGSISPGTATTFGGSVLAVYTAPAQQGGTVTITATSVGVTGSATLTVDCGTVPTAVPPTAVPTSSTGGAITPPSTGDAGLSTSGSSLPTYLGLGLIALAVSLGTAGVLGVVRNRIR